MALLSARLSVHALTHLLSATSTKAVICSTKTERPVVDAIRQLSKTANAPVLVTALSYQTFIKSHSAGNAIAGIQADLQRTVLEDEPGALILHSSGTTGLPKPILLAQRYLLGYAACHRLSPEEAEGRLNVSTLPLYHVCFQFIKVAKQAKTKQGFGLLAPCLSLSVGKPCCFPSSSVIPAADSTVELLKTTGACSLMTVPAVLEQIVSSSGQSYRDELAGLDFLAIGGGSLKPSVGDALVREGVNLLNHYGATELGAIAYIHVPDESYDWRYLRLRNDMGLELKEIEDSGEKSGRFKLSGHPFGWNAPFEIQDSLKKRFDDSSIDNMEVQVLGRTDDVIVLATGEKVWPQLIESKLSELPFIKTAVVFGEQQNEVGILVEVADGKFFDGDQGFIDLVWSNLQEFNRLVDGHARVSSRDAILVKPHHKTIPRSDKGSVMRKEVYDTFAQEISAVYQGLETSMGTQLGIRLNKQKLEEDLRALVQACLQDRLPSFSWKIEDDFFEIGMDSLEATRLSRYLGKTVNIDEFPGITPGMTHPCFVYRNPTVARLAAAIRGLASDPGANVVTSRTHQMQLIKDKHDLNLQTKTQTLRQKPLVVMLTGSTGNLGAHLLWGLAHSQQVQRIICVNRGSNYVRPEREAEMDMKARQESVNVRHGLSIRKELWEKIYFLASDTQSPGLGLDSRLQEELVCQVTHVLHNAWPMDFQRSLESYESQFRVVENLLDFCRRAHHAQHGVKPKLLFLSSIAVGGRYPEKVLSEKTLDDPSTTVPMGYAEAKWVCEQILTSAAKHMGDVVEPTIVRIGQLSGSSITGYWNPREHIPALIKASQAIGALPALEGVSRSICVDAKGVLLIAIQSFSWLPTDIASKVILDILLARGPGDLYYHVENPIRQPWADVLQYLAYVSKPRLQNPLPFDEWTHRAAALTTVEGFPHLADFLKSDFRNLSGRLVLDTQHSRELSPHLRSCGGVSLELIDKYLHSWKQQ